MSFLQRWFRRGSSEQEISDELRDHLERQTDANIAAGIPRDEARRQAMLQFGGAEAVKEDCREQSSGFWLETLWSDVRYGVRICGNTAIFSVVNGVLLNPLPFPHPEELVSLSESKPNFATGSISYLNFRDWQRNNHTFSAMAISRQISFSLTGSGEAEQLQAELLSSDYFSLLGVKPVLGPMFVPGEDEVGAAPIVLISAGLWKRGIGRLRPGVSIEQARADMDEVTRNLIAAYPDTDKGIGAAVRPLKQDMLGEVRPLLLLLLGAVCFALLIACANVANLLLARSTSRAREFAIRAALGAAKGRLIRQLLTESILLGIAGGGLGLLR